MGGDPRSDSERVEDFFSQEEGPDATGRPSGGAASDVVQTVPSPGYRVGVSAMFVLVLLLDVLITPRPDSSAFAGMRPSWFAGLALCAFGLWVWRMMDRRTASITPRARMYMLLSIMLGPVLARFMTALGPDIAAFVLGSLAAILIWLAMLIGAPRTAGEGSGQSAPSVVDLLPARTVLRPRDFMDWIGAFLFTGAGGYLLVTIPAAQPDAAARIPAWLVGAALAAVSHITMTQWGSRRLRPLPSLWFPLIFMALFVGLALAVRTGTAVTLAVDLFISSIVVFVTLEGAFHIWRLIRSPRAQRVHA